MLTIYKRYRGWFVSGAVAAQVAAAMVGAYLLRFEYVIPASEAASLYRGVWIAVLVKLIVFRLTGCYRLGWRHIGIFDVTRLLISNAIASAAFAGACLVLIGPRFPRSVYVIDFLLCLLLTAGSRISVRLYYEQLLREVASPGRRRVLIYGAGAAGMTLAREILSNASLGYRVAGFIDDDPRKRNRSFLGVPVLGSGRSVPLLAERMRKRETPIDEVIIAMPSAPGTQIREALANCRAASLVCTTIPSVGELLAGKVLTSQIRNVTVEDLLGREQVVLEEAAIRSCISGKVIMITGGGGSIGAELCRQVASYGPRKLIIFERAESDLFRIEMELGKRFPGVSVVAEIGDIREYSRVDRVMRHYGVDSVLHAAAYKHVPMMEAHLLEAVRNNVLGTWNVVKAASHTGVSSFLMISSDKAVNPTNIMGLTKRVAELIVSAMPNSAEGSATRFVSVRFGNVLGSNGSVVPIFTEQIRAGGPVTVTHPDMRRYFMTIPEAVQLVLQASTMGKGSEVFVLDMGEPVRIVDLARNMIRLSGREPDVDIEIRFTGLRPGEKLFEEVMTEGENISPTYHHKIRIFNGPRQRQVDMAGWMMTLQELLRQGDEQAILEHLRSIVPEYLPSARWQTEVKRIATAV